MQTNFTRWIGLLILLGVCAAAALLLIPVAAPAPVITQVPVAAPVQAYPPPVANTPLPTLVYAYPPPGSTQSAAMRVPLCQFQGAATAPEVNAVALEDYVFSEPMVVLTSTTPLSIADWLPDNQRLLVTRRLPDSADEWIETFNLVTGETKVYAQRNSGESPVWLPSLEAVAYTHAILDERLPRGGRLELRVSYGDPKNFEVVAQDVFNLSLATDGSRLLYFDRTLGDQVQAWNFSTHSVATTQFNLTNRAYKQNPIFQSRPGTTFKIAPQPNGQWTAFYSFGLLYLADAQTGQLCEIEIGDRIPYNVRWSPNGRYLAFLSADYNSGGLYTSSKVVVLDTTTGEQVFSNLEFPVVYEIDWGLDNHTLAILVLVDVIDGGRPIKEVFLMNAAEGNTRRMLPEHWFGGGTGNELRWSQDGRVLAIDCTQWRTKTLPSEGRVCFIEVTQ
ncbi:MAG: hypothetical protein OHK0052_25370 [Anaerolineales bacterium]